MTTSLTFTKLKRNWITAIALAIGITFLTYVLIRAYNIPFTHDESFTYLNFVKMERWGVVSIFAPHTNNHLLNTLLMVPFSLTFGQREFFLRLPNVISFIIYLYYSYKICDRFSQKVVALCIFALLCLNPFLLDFFGLARGYGLAICFMMASLYYLLKWIDNSTNSKSIDILKIILPASLAVYSNLVFLNYLAAISLFLLLTAYLREKKSVFDFRKFTHYLFSKNALIILGNVFFVVTSLILPILIMKQRNDFQLGGTTNFWQDTVQSLIQASFYEKDYSNIIFITVQLTLACIVCYAFLASLKVLIDKLTRERKDILVYLYFITTIITLEFIQFTLIGTKYLVERSALIFYPFLILLFAAIFTSIQSVSSFTKNAGYMILFIVMLAFMVNFYFSFNLTHTRNWKYDVSTKQMLKDLENEHDSGSKVTLGLSWIFEPATSFYIEKYKLNWVEPLKKEDSPALKNYDYYYLSPLDQSDLKLNDYVIINQYDKTGNILLKKKTI